MQSTLTKHPGAIRVAETIIFAGLAVATAVLLGAFEPAHACTFQPSEEGKFATYLASALMLAGAAAYFVLRRHGKSTVAHHTP